MKNILKAILLLLAIFIVPTMVFAEEVKPVEPDYSWYESSDKETYEISNEAQLLGFANIVNGKAENIEKNTFEGQTIYLTKNIDLTGITWTPIGSSMYDHSPEEATTKMFSGTFDGRYHTIKGLSSDGYKALEEDISSGEHSYGFIGYAYGASLKNIYFEDVSIKCSGDAGADGSGVAVAIGYYVPKDGAKSLIENVNLVSGTVQATNNMGGIIGFMDTHGSELNLEITIKDCTNNVDVTTDAREAGGILGLFQNAEGHTGYLKFINCVNNGSITANDGAGNSVAAGILGKDQSYSNYTYKFKIYYEDCVNTGKITVNGRSNSENHAAGISTAYYTRGAPVVLNNCINTGDITITGTSKTNFISGLIAHPQLESNNGDEAIVQNSSYNTGKITYPSLSTAIVVYDINGGTGKVRPTKQTVSKNMTLNDGSNLSREGYILVGWNTKMDGTGTSYKTGSTILAEESLILYAEWRKTNTGWSVANIPPQLYTGKPIKPSLVVFDDDNNIIDSSKYTVTYENNDDCINIGSHKVKITYNSETVELDYLIIKSRPTVTIKPSSKEIKSNEVLTITVTGVEKNNVELICDDKEVTIKNKGNNVFEVKLPNKDATYLFTAVSKETDNHYSVSISTLVTGIKTEEYVLGEKEEKPETPVEKEEVPKTSDNIYITVATLLIASICVISAISLNKMKNN